eukprot:TRINITY_DN5112_c0_g1_i1.p1 TRINITY_DN5112_c0_g1~~TRINITY_DN5112_c0_g1_i1.p1  ORF type:complete len:270 (+),score=21.66 TRINITY_DN5112_c0_g1_i1:553-1362(+)
MLGNSRNCTVVAHRNESTIGETLGRVRVVRTRESKGWCERLSANFFPNIARDATHVSWIDVNRSVCMLIMTNLCLRSFLYVLAGFLLGWLGFPVLYCSTVLGGWATFLISKQLVKRGYLSWRAVYIRFTSYETYIRAVERAVSDQSYKAAVLLQLSGSPYGLLNMLLALSKITFWQFVIATLISRLKLIQYILLGTILKTVAELSSFTSGNLSNPSYLIITGISFVVSTIAVFYVYYYAKKELKLMRPRPPTVVSILDTDAMPPRPTSQ